MARIIKSFSEIARAYDALYCDLWGCLHDGIRPFPEAVAALSRYRQGGGIVALMTNAPRPSTWVVRTLDAMGVPRDCYDIVVSSGDAAQAGMLAGVVGRKVWHLGSEKDLPFFEDFTDDISALKDRSSPVERVSLDQAEGIVCTGLIDDFNETPEDYRADLLRAKALGLRMLCANPDLVVDMGDRRLYCAGALAELYTQMGGESLYFGKPHPPIYDLARSRLARAAERDIAQDRILAVGDGIGTDVRGAVAEDLDVVFVTGGIAAAETGTIAGTPDPAMLDAFLSRQEITPTYAMGALR